MNIDPQLPFRTKIKPLFLPKEMHEPPVLDHAAPPSPVKRFHALLINPFYPKDPRTSFGKHVLTPTLALTSVAGSTPEHWTVEYFDENLLQGRPPADPLPEVVGITVHLTFARRAYELARWYRARGSLVVLGGLHALSCPEEVAPHADALAVGDGVQLWPQILRDVEAGRLQPRYASTYESDYRLDPPARRRLLPRTSFLTTTSMIATRGCHNRCGFCYLATDGLRMPYRTRDAETVAQEIRDDGQPYVVFIDNNLGSRREYLHELCRALQAVGIIWSAAVTLDVTDDPRLIRAMALAGCTGVFVGFESLSDANIQHAKKRSPRADDYARRVRLFHDNGIQVNGSFVLGFDEDRPDVFARTASWIEENRLECATFHILTPYPGTPLFREMETQRRLLHRDWSLYDTGHVVFRPKHLSPEELVQGYHWMYQHLFSLCSIWRRRPEDFRAVLPYLAMSLLYKRSNRLWHFLIRHRLTHAAWRPLVEWNRMRHQSFRARLATRPIPGVPPEENQAAKDGDWPSDPASIRASTVVSAGV
jgi:radical SAM superfamily enzyme YgiQ (UPF0313 family)